MPTRSDLDKEYRMLWAISIAFISFFILIFLFGYYFFGFSLITFLLPAITMSPFVFVICGIIVSPQRALVISLKSIMVSLVVLVMSLLIFSLFFYDSIPISDENKLNNLRIFMTVGSAGMFGGLMKAFLEESVKEEDGPNLWEVIYSIVVALFVSVVLFFLLRAGIINQTRVDTFNVWGVAGVSAITGFFSSKIIDRFRKLFHEIIGENNDQK